MTVMRVSISYDLEPLKKIMALEDPTGRIEEAFRTWGVIYRAAMQERFMIFSRGGGDWPPLAPSTIAGRRHGKGGKHKRGKKALARARASGGGQVSILYDTGLLYAALDPNFGPLPGQYQEILKNGLRVGFGGPGAYPEGGATIADIAGFHQEGGPKLPQRKILVDPPEETKKKMAEALDLALRDLTSAA